MKMISGRKIRAFLAAVFVLGVVSLSACDNPFDPLSETDDIQGLTYFDWAGEWAKWTSTAGFSGFLVTLEYFNQYGDSLEFNDKSHKVKIEFYTQKNVGGTVDPDNPDAPPTGGYTSFDQLLFTYTVTHKNTADDIRIPRELYENALLAGGDDYNIENPDLEGIVKVYILITIYPPEGKPVKSLQVGYPDQEVLKLDTSPTPNP